MAATALIIGGYGYAGRSIAPLLLENSELDLIIGGRNLHQARRLADKLNNTLESKRVDALKVDASDRTSLLHAFEQVELVIVAATTTRYARTVCEAALEAGVDYLDCQLSARHKVEVLNQLKGRIKREERCFITDAGYHPGLPGLMVRWAAEKLDVLETARVGVLMKVDWSAYDYHKESMREMVAEFNNYQPLLYANGVWHENWRASKLFDFGAPFGDHRCVPYYLEELHQLPVDHPSMRDLACYISGFNGFTDKLALPLTAMSLKVAPRAAQKYMPSFFGWSLRRFSRPPFGNVLKLDGAGFQGDEPARVMLEIRHDDPYRLTAAPVVACIKQYLQKRRPGLWFQAHFVEPLTFVDDLKKMGIQIHERVF